MDENIDKTEQVAMGWIQRHIYPLRWFWVVLAIGVFIRAWTVKHTVLINPDGALYIYQAKVILNGHWHNLTSCGLSFVSIYPILITGAHLFIRDWILSAQAVSFAFSSATLIPLYLLLRRFFDDRISGLALIVAALSPVMCSRSGDVVRDPIYWFFLSLGIYQTILFFEDRGSFFRLSIAAIAFMLAAWARIEAVFLLLFTFVVVLLLGKKDLLKRVASYGWPLFLISLGLILSIIVFDIPMLRLLRIDDILDNFVGFLHAYQHISSSIGILAKDHISESMRLFLPEAQNNIWLIAIGTILNRTLEAFFYPYVLFFIIGLWRYPWLRAQDNRWRFLLLASCGAYILLYMHLLHTWILEYRFMMLVLLPGLPFAGAGIHWVLKTIGSKWNSSKWISMGLAAILIAVALPKNFQSRDPDKIVFRQIAELANSQTTEGEPVLISSSIHTHRLLSLYANKDLSDPPCPETAQKILWSAHADNLDALIKNLKSSHFQFFLYEENNWPKTGIDFNPSIIREDFKLLGQWYHRDTGDLQLYRIVK